MSAPNQTDFYKGIFLEVILTKSPAVYGINVAAGPIDHGVDATDLAALKNFRDRVFKPGLGLTSKVANNKLAMVTTLYPNPNNGLFYVASAQTATKINAIKIFDIRGRIIETFTEINKSATEIRLTNKGFFMVQICDENGQSTYERVIVQ